MQVEMVQVQPPMLVGTAGFVAALRGVDDGVLLAWGHFVIERARLHIAAHPAERGGHLAFLPDDLPGFCVVVEAVELHRDTQRRRVGYRVMVWLVEELPASVQALLPG